MKYLWYFIIIISVTAFCVLTEKTNIVDLNSKINSMKFPVANKKPKLLSMHNDVRVDNYFWMRLTDAQKEAETPGAERE